MRRIFCLALSVLLLLSLCACGKKKEPVNMGFTIGDEFTPVSFALESELPSVKSYLKGQDVPISDDGETRIKVYVDDSMADNDYAYCVESTTSIVVRGGSKASTQQGLKAFCEDYLLATPIRINVSVQKTYTEAADKTVESAVPGWYLQSEMLWHFADGVTYEEKVYADKDGDPHRAFILTADPKKVSIHYGTSNDEYTLYPEVKQNVREHMQASVKSGFDVIAAVNGDFFAIDSTFAPSGITIKNGQLLTVIWPSWPFTGVTKDGKFIIETTTPRNYDVSNLQNAIAGRNILVRDGEVYVTALGAGKGTEPHPRTMAGLKKDGSLILAVIDGRRSSWSNGATLQTAGHFMHSLGCVTAINHDGGGSSTMILRRYNNYEVVNRPSDGGLRDVYGSIQIVRKQEKVRA